jgi:hypothetical protein
VWGLFTAIAKACLKHLQKAPESVNLQSLSFYYNDCFKVLTLWHDKFDNWLIYWLLSKNPFAAQPSGTLGARFGARNAFIAARFDMATIYYRWGG